MSINQQDDQTTPLVGGNAMTALRQAAFARQQRSSLNQPASSALEPQDPIPNANQPTPGAYGQGERATQQAMNRQAAMQTSINNSSVAMHDRGNDDNYQRDDSSPIRRNSSREGGTPTEVSPFDHNPNPGASLPDWRQFGFESAEAYNQHLHEARIQERLAARREGRDQPPPEQPAHRGWMERFYGNNDNEQAGQGNNDQANANNNHNGANGAAAPPNDDIDAVPGHVPRIREERPRMTPSERFKKQNKYELLKQSCFAAACLTCLFALPMVNKGCEFQSTVFNMAFFYTCIVTETVLRLLVQFFFTTNDEDVMTKRVFVLKAVSGILYAAWAIYVLNTFDSFTPHCYDPYPSFSLAVFSVIICFILPQAFIVMCAITIAAIFSPCIIYTYCTHRADENRQRETRQGVIDQTPKVTYDTRRFWGITNCVICLSDFQDGDQVTPLRCDMRHTFHQSCIVDQFNYKNECPVCRCHINPEDMRIQSQEIEQILEERGRKFDIKQQQDLKGENMV